MFNNVKSFIIDRTNWLRGEGSKASRLLRPTDEKMCCVGIYLKACGVPRDQLLDTAAVESRRLVSGGLSLDSVSDTKLAIPILPEGASWLRDDFKHCSGPTPAASALYSMNDYQASDMPERYREEGIRNLFAKQGVEVTFVDGQENTDGGQ